MAKYNLPVDKHQVATQLGVNIARGGDNTSRENGRVGGEMVRRTFEQFGQR